MSEASPAFPEPDPLHRNVDLSVTVRLPVLGVPVRFASNSREAYDAILEWFGMWEHLGAYPELAAAEEVQVRIIVHDGTAEPPVRTPVVYRMPDRDRVLVHTPGSIGIVDTTRRDAVAYVTPALLADRGHFQYGILEMMTLVLVTLRDRVPLHAAMVARDGVALLLAGRSGLGKSTLAYQARRAGWTLLADDGVYVQTSPVHRLWGAPLRLHLPPDAGRWFPELAASAPRIQANGKRKIAVPHVHDWMRDGPPVVQDAAVCLLDRARGDAATVERVAPGVVRDALLADLAPARDLYGDAAPRVITSLAAGGGWRLSLTSRPPDAQPLLEQLAGELVGF